MANALLLLIGVTVVFLLDWIRRVNERPSELERLNEQADVDLFEHVQLRPLDEFDSNITVLKRQPSGYGIAIEDGWNGQVILAEFADDDTIFNEVVLEPDELEVVINALEQRAEAVEER